LISKRDIRYEGTLYSINEQEATVALQNVRSYGTEGREKAPHLAVPARPDTVHDWLVFRGCDIQDLHVHDRDTAALRDDPAIVSANDPQIAKPVSVENSSRSTLVDNSSSSTTKSSNSTPVVNSVKSTPVDKSTLATKPTPAEKPKPTLAAKPAITPAASKPMTTPAASAVHTPTTATSSTAAKPTASSNQPSKPTNSTDSNNPTSGPPPLKDLPPPPAPAVKPSSYASALRISSKSSTSPTSSKTTSTSPSVPPAHRKATAAPGTGASLVHRKERGVKKGDVPKPGLLKIIMLLSNCHKVGFFFFL